MSSIPSRRPLVAFAASGALALAACSHTGQQAAQSPPPPNEEMGITNPQPPSPSPAPVPDTPTATNVSISAEILRACDIPDADAYFAFDSSRLTSFDQGPLDRLSACLTSGPLKGQHIALVGHADPRGRPEYNLTLGQSRADAVGQFLRLHGLSETQMTTTSRGAMDAVGHDETGWAHDRRVDVDLAH
jgi:peptidoglycan-associated lipoprotein